MDDQVKDDNYAVSTSEFAYTQGKARETMEELRQVLTCTQFRYFIVVVCSIIFFNNYECLTCMV